METNSNGNGGKIISPRKGVDPIPNRWNYGTMIISEVENPSQLPPNWSSGRNGGYKK